MNDINRILKIAEGDINNSRSINDLDGCIMIEKGNDIGHYYFICGPSIGGGFISDDIFISSYLINIAKDNGIELGNFLHDEYFEFIDNENFDYQFDMLINILENDGFKVV